MKPIEGLESAEWNFDTVPDAELIACCYWEYARESAFLRDVRVRCLDPKWREMTNTQLAAHCGDDIERIQSIGHPAEVFLRGFFCPPDGVLTDAPPLREGEVNKLTGSFPKPWQALTPQERAYRAVIRTDRSFVPLVPFERALCFEAKDIAEQVKRQSRALELEREQVRRENPKLNEEALHRLGKMPFREIQPSLRWESGSETTVVRIQWAEFTNDELVTHFRHWVKANRPKNSQPPDARGRKPGDWRAHLTRLAAMRILSRVSATELVGGDRFPEVWKTGQFGGKKWADPTKWRDARREAGAMFRQLFPFLSKDEKPRSWRRQTGP